MPFRRRRKTQARRRRPAGFATRPKFIPRGLAFKRFNQLSTKCFYFKTAGSIDTGPTSQIFFNWNVQNITGTPPPQMAALFQMYDEYKVLSMRVRLFPANVGIESDSAIVGSNALSRGDQIIWSDQKGDAVVVAPISIAERINYGSCRMINPRRPITRVIFRPTGHPDWGKCQDPAAQPDSWTGNINLYGVAVTVTTGVGRPLWYLTRTYKILVRGRRS